MQKFPSTEAKDKWGLIAETAIREPVSITRHGRPSLVVTSIQDYEELQRIKFEALKAEIRAAINQGEKGEVVEIRTADDQRVFLEDIKTRGRKRIGKGKSLQ